MSGSPPGRRVLTTTCLDRQPSGEPSAVEMRFGDLGFDAALLKMQGRRTSGKIRPEGGSAPIASYRSRRPSVMRPEKEGIVGTQSLEVVHHQSFITGPQLAVPSRYPRSRKPKVSY
jgi:hypothetical protein